MKQILLIILATVLLSCGNHPISVTKEKIINKNWSEDPRQGTNGMSIQEVIVVNDSLDYYLDKGFLNYNDFEESNSFHYRVNFGEEKVKEVFFDREYNWKWFDVQSKKEVNKIGVLNTDTWYKFSGLTNNTKFSLYVYVDEEGKAHQYPVNRSNY